MDNSNESEYFADISDYPSETTPTTTLARMIDGLGFRYYWASKDLRDEDLNYNPGNEGKSSLETLEHICELSFVVLFTVKNEPISKPFMSPNLPYNELRSLTLSNLETASKILQESPTLDLSHVNVNFIRGENTLTYPFWNIINGPISDAIYHTGQIVTFRRSSGNPITSGISFLRGTQKNQ